ncbi:MAG: chromosome partitioning protein, partial [Pseudomonadota bacterium]
MSSDPLAPYHGISPDDALTAIGAPLDTEGFARIADACRQGRDDLAGRGLNEAGDKTLRRFSTWEITKYLIPVAPAHFRRVLRQNPDLPQGRTETEGGAKWFTLDEVLQLRVFFA